MRLHVVRQAGMALWLSLLSLQKRWWSTLNAVIGTGSVVGVLVAILSIAAGYNEAMRMTGGSDNVIVMRSGARSEMESSLTGEQARLIRNAEPIARDEDGEPLAAAEVYAIANVNGHNGQSMNVGVRGVEPASYRLRPGLRITQGRAPMSGRNEVLVGKQAQQAFAGLERGSTFRFGDAAWTVVGVFEADGSIVESEIWAEATLLQAAYRRGDSVQVVFGRLAAKATVDQLNQTLRMDARITATAVTEESYYQEQSSALGGFVGTLGYGIASLMGIGAVFAALNTSYAAVAARAKEIGVLDTLGMDRRAITSAIIAEAVLLALAGATLGSLVAYILYHGRLTSTLFFSRNFSQVVFAFTITPGLLLQATLGAMAIGLMAGLGAARQMRRIPLAQTLAQRR